MDWKPKIESTHALSNLRYFDFKFNQIQKAMALKKHWEILTLIRPLFN